MEQKKVRIKIKDLPKDMKVSREEMKKILGGATQPVPDRPAVYITYRYPYSPWGPVGESGACSGCGCG